MSAALAVKEKRFFDATPSFGGKITKNLEGLRMRWLVPTFAAVLCVQLLGQQQDEKRKHPQRKVAEVISALTSDDFLTRKKAHQQILPLIKKEPETLDMFLKVLKQTKDAHIKAVLADTLRPYTRWGITSAVLKRLPDIAKWLNRNEGPLLWESFQRAAAELGKVGGVAAVRVLERMLAALKKASGRRALEASFATVTALGAANCKEAVPLLVKLLKDKNAPWLRRAAIHPLVALHKHSFTELVKLLGEKDDFVRWSAAFALGIIGDEKAIKPLVKLLNDKDDLVRAEAAFSLSRIGKSAVPLLIEKLKDKDGEIRALAAEALGYTKDRRAVAALLGALKDDKEVVVRAMAAQALGDLKLKEASPALIEVLKDRKEREYVREKAAEALGKIGLKEAADVLLEVVKDEKEGRYIRCAAAEALGRLGEKRAVEALIKLLQSGLDSAEGVFLEAMLRESAARALAMLCDERATKALQKSLKDKVQSVQAWARVALCRTAPHIANKATPDISRDAAEFLILGLLPTPLPPQRMAKMLKECTFRNGKSGAAIKKLLMKALKGEAQVKDVLTVVKDNKHQLDERFAAIVVLATLSDKEEVFKALTGMLANGDPLARQIAPGIIGILGHKKGESVLLMRLVSDCEEVVAANAAMGLAFGDYRQDTIAIIEALLKPTVALGGFASWTAPWVFRILRTRHAAATLLALIPQMRSKKEVLLTLERLGWDAVDSLVEGLRSGGLNVRRMAVEALKRITNKDFGTDWKKWRDWTRKHNER